MPRTSFHRFSFIFIMVVLSSYWIGCHTANDRNKKESVIEAYSSSIKLIQLPFIDTCYDTLAVQQANPPDSLFQFEEYSQLIGKVSENNHYIAILCTIPADVQLPILEVFNKNGEKIASLSLLEGDCCGENEACSGISTVCITKDLHIILKDSTQTFERDKKNADKKYHVQIEKRQREYMIDSTGRILPLT